MRVLVCGDRNWSSYKAIKRELLKLPKGVTIIHGAARGADSISGEIAEDLGLKVKAYPADWDRYGRAAGPIRNQQMLKEGRPDLCLAFHPDIKASKGTRDMVLRIRKAGIKFHVFRR